MGRISSPIYPNQPGVFSLLASRQTKKNMSASEALYSLSKRPPPGLNNNKNHDKIYNYIWGASKNSGTPKWMVKIMEHPIKMDDLGVPLFLETSIQNYIENFTGTTSTTSW